jgi:amino acid transporter
MLLLFFTLPLSSIILFFIKDSKKERKKILNAFLIVNTLLYFFPLAFAFLATFPSGNMWDENGPGVVLWFYFIIFPLCILFQIILIILKIINYMKSRKFEKNESEKNETPKHVN